MKQVKHYLASLCLLLTVAAPLSYGQSITSGNRGPVFENQGGNFVDRFTRRYTPQHAPPVNLSNSSRMDSLIRAGNLYLTLEDAIALALENNIGLEQQRYNFETLAIAVRSAEANPGINLDPILTSTFGYSHSASIVTNAVGAGGVPVNTGNSQTRNFNFQQGFKTGATTQVGFNNSQSTTNNINNAFIPSLTSGLSAQITQPLLAGFGLSLNTRQLRIAQNNARGADYTFQQNINTTLNTVIQAYWNLLSATLNVDVVRQSQAQAERLLSDNRKQVEIGTMAAIEVVQSETAVSQAELNVLTAEQTVLQQELTLKDALSRNGISNASLALVHIIPVSRATVPEVEPIQPIQDLMETALTRRPELGTQRISMENAQINMKATRNALLPSLNLNATISNPAQGGVLNPKEVVNGQLVDRDLSKLNLSLFGGYANVLRQLFLVPTVNYNISATFTLNLRNRVAQATYATSEINYRTSELALQSQINQIRLQVNTAQLNINTARARYFLAVKQSAQQAQVLDAEQRKLALGASSTFQVITFQNQLLTAKQAEVTAQVAYVNAKLAMDVATSNLMEKYNIVYDEARTGALNRRPDPIPDVINQPRP